MVVCFTKGFDCVQQIEPMCFFAERTTEGVTHDDVGSNRVSSKRKSHGTGRHYKVLDPSMRMFMSSLLLLTPANASVTDAQNGVLAIEANPWQDFPKGPQIIILTLCICTTLIIRWICCILNSLLSNAAWIRIISAYFFQSAGRQNHGHQNGPILVEGKRSNVYDHVLCRYRQSSSLRIMQWTL